MKKFNVHKYNDDQIIEAVTHPINRHAVRVKFGVDDWWLHDHTDELVKHWLENGGAEEFAKRRKQYEDEQVESRAEEETDM